MLKEAGYKAGRISQLIKATRPAATPVSHGTPESKKGATASKTKKAETLDDSETGGSSTEADESSSGAKAHRRERKAKEEKKREKVREETTKRKHQKGPCPSQASSSKSKKAKKASKSPSEEEAPKVRVRRVARVGSDGRPTLTQRSRQRMRNSWMGCCYVPSRSKALEKIWRNGTCLSSRQMARLPPSPRQQRMPRPYLRSCLCTRAASEIVCGEHLSVSIPAVVPASRRAKAVPLSKYVDDFSYPRVFVVVLTELLRHFNHSAFA